MLSALERLLLYSGMNNSLDEIFAHYDDAQLDTLADFLARAAAAGHDATSDLAEAEE